MKYRIFIVEDDETIANLLKKHLSSWGYDVFLAEDFSNILQEFAGKDPQLVLLDLKLPFYNGFHWCEEIRKVSQVPVIFISSPFQVSVALERLRTAPLCSRTFPGFPKE